MFERKDGKPLTKEDWKDIEKAIRLGAQKMADYIEENPDVLKEENSLLLRLMKGNKFQKFSGAHIDFPFKEEDNDKTD